MSFGYHRGILRVNLTDGRITVETPDDVFYRRYLGGAGFIAYYLLKEVPPDTDPLGPQNRLIFACGPLTGAPMAGSGRNAIGARSPLTGAMGEADVGGFWGAELKAAGFDAIVYLDFIVAQPSDLCDPEDRPREPGLLVHDLRCSRLQFRRRDRLHGRMMSRELLEEFRTGILVMSHTGEVCIRRFAQTGCVELELIAEDSLPNLILSRELRGDVLVRRASADSD